MNDQNNMFGNTPLFKNRKIEKCQSIELEECPKLYSLGRKGSIKNIILDIHQVQLIENFNFSIFK